MNTYHVVEIVANVGKAMMRRNILGTKQIAHKDKHIYKESLLECVAKVLEK